MIPTCGYCFNPPQPIKHLNKLLKQSNRITRDGAHM